MPLALTCIAGDRTVLGIAALLGARTLIEEGMTGNLDTDLEAKFRAAAAALATSDLVVVHVKGADIASRDLKPQAKVAFLERLDAALGQLLQSCNGRLRVAVTCDHATSERKPATAPPIRSPSSSGRRLRRRPPRPLRRKIRRRRQASAASRCKACCPGCFH